MYMLVNNTDNYMYDDEFDISDSGTAGVFLTHLVAGSLFTFLPIVVINQCHSIPRKLHTLRRETCHIMTC